jgi:hypothetical protein
MMFKKSLFIVNNNTKLEVISGHICFIYLTMKCILYTFIFVTFLD